MASNEPVRVQQCDREAAADWLNSCVRPATLDDLATAFARHRTLSQSDGRGEALETARRLYRGLEMQAEIMRDRRRTGGWDGAENVARAFERQAEKAKELHAFLSAEVHQEKNDGRPS